MKFPISHGETLSVFDRNLIDQTRGGIQIIETWKMENGIKMSSDVGKLESTKFEAPLTNNF